MSSFVVAPKTMNRILSFLDDQMSGNSIHKWAIEDILTRYRIIPAGKNLTLDEKTLQKLAKSLWGLNVEAVYQRYGDAAVDKMPGTYTDQTFKKLAHNTPYEHTPVNAIQAYKSLQCLTYQCAEGNVPNSPLYKMLEELENSAVRQIVHDLPEYDKAEWD